MGTTESHEKGHTFIRSQRGLPLLAKNNFIYRCERTRNHRSYWLCIRYKTHKCKGRLICQKNAVLKETKHCHPDDRRRLTMSDKSSIDLSKINVNAWVKSVCPRKEYIRSQRGYPLLVLKNFLFRKNRGRYWRCIRCTKYKCRSRVTLKDDGVVLYSGKHTHGPETAKIQMGRKLRDMPVPPLAGHNDPVAAASYRHYLARQPHSIQKSQSRWPVVYLLDDVKPLPKIWYTVPLNFVDNRQRRKKQSRRNSFNYDLPYEMINNRKGGLNLHFRGYVYRRKTNFSQTTNWVCANPLSSRNENAIGYPGPCAARCITDGAASLQHAETLFNRHGVWLDELPYSVVLDSGGKRMRMLGYTYRKAASFRSTTDWVCVRNCAAAGNPEAEEQQQRRCMARLVQRMEDGYQEKRNTSSTKSTNSECSDSDENLAVFSKTMRGKEQLIYMGQPFVFEKLVLAHGGQSKKIWRCNQWWNQKCRARVYTIDRQITPLNRYHTHVDIVKRKQRVVKRDKNSNSSADGGFEALTRNVIKVSDANYVQSGSTVSKSVNTKTTVQQPPPQSQPSVSSSSYNTTPQPPPPPPPPTKPKENKIVISSKARLPRLDGKQKIIDQVPLHAGSSVYIATKDLLSIYTSKPAIYTGRLIELMFGVETLKLSCLNDSEKTDPSLVPLDPTILDSVITDKQLTKRKGTKLISLIDNEHVMFTETANGGTQLMYQNYIYHRNIKTGGTVYWRCSKAMRLKCKATIVTKGDLMRVNNVEHNHVPMRRLAYGLGVNEKRKLKKQHEAPIFIAISPERQLISLRNKLYQKTIGRAYRSVWMCIEYGCPGEIVLRELKGGQITITSAHNDD
uniref:BEN domain-containing protein n=1 Tax=Anopheles maculatus TaxID=74869 RepID=A0A182S6H5_9DIPT